MGRLAHQTELIHAKLKRKSPSRRTGDRSSKNIVIVRGALEFYRGPVSDAIADQNLPKMVEAPSPTILGGA
jgi:hypothetical protein